MGLGNRSIASLTLSLLRKSRVHIRRCSPVSDVRTDAPLGGLVGPPLAKRLTLGVSSLRREAGYGRQDYPNMSDRGEQYLTRVAASETIKSFGNEAFNAGDFVTANRKYTKVREPTQHKQQVA